MKGLTQLCLSQSSKVWKNYHHNLQHKYSQERYIPEIQLIEIEGREVIRLKYKSIQSTMIPAQNWSSQLITSKRTYIFQCEEQTQGKGQSSNSWSSPQGNLHMTVLTEVNHQCLPFLSIIAGSAVTQTIRQMIPSLEIKNKWINDVFIKERKVAGVLTKCSFTGNKMLGVIGIGVNVSTEPMQGSTCLNKHTEQRIQLDSFSTILVKNLLQGLENLRQSLIRYTDDLAYLGEEVVIYDPTLTTIQHKGIFKGINEYGHALLQSEEKDLSVASGRMRQLKHSNNQS